MDDKKTSKACSQVSISLPQDMNELLDEITRKTGMPKSMIIQRLIESNRKMLNKAAKDRRFNIWR